VVKGRVHTAVSVLCLLPLLFPGKGWAQPAATPVAGAPQFIVIGFVGGFVRHDDLVHSEVQLAARLRKEYPSIVHAETFENHRGEQARQEILRLLDVDHDGKLSKEEKRNARIILYGHSWGASEALILARQLQKTGIRVLLTVQVDSVSKDGENDALVPANVSQAVNFYQPDGLIHGETKIYAADPVRTRILGNFRFDYKAHPVTCRDYPWFSRTFMKPHIEIECDPKVWNQVESLIRLNLPPETESASAMND
jgi:pimeloyl-ACP methyl ester carboxylesterase